MSAENEHQMTNAEQDEAIRAGIVEHVERVGSFIDALTEGHPDAEAIRDGSYGQPSPEAGERFVLLGNGWLASETGECSCGTVAPAPHEPGCGLEPIATVGSLLAAAAMLGAASERRLWVAEFPAPGAPADADVVPTVMVGSSHSAADAYARARQQDGVTADTDIRIIEQITRTIVTRSEVTL